MANLILTAKEQITSALQDAAKKAFESGALVSSELAPFNIEITSDAAHGDFAANAAMVSARNMRTSPRNIADALVANLDLSESYFERCEVAGPGFINFFLSKEWAAEVIGAVLSEGENYGRSDYGRGEKVMVEFVSANPTGPMHIGNARGGALGDCLAAVLDWSGHDVTREFYINDAGNQIDKFALSLDVRYLQHYLGEDAVKLPEDAYHGADIKDRAVEFANEYGDRYVKASESERRAALVEFALPKNIAALKTDLEKYRIYYDVWFHESELHKSGLVKKVIGILTDKGLTYEKEGALWYKNAEFMAEKYRAQGKSEAEIEKLELKDEVLIRANGNPTYFAADIAYHYNKFAQRGFDRVINVWGADHHGHVARLCGAMDAVGLQGDKLHIVLMQLVKLMRDGEVVRVSKRTGKSITLSDLLNEVDVDAARLFFNLREPASHLDFDLDLAVSQNAQNPVYYVQYAHARICSIIKALAADGIEVREATRQELCLLTASEEKELIAHLAKLTDEIVGAAKHYDPAKITRYVIDLATLFHKFYNANRVKLPDNEPLMQARIALCLSVKTVIKNVLTMFGISVPESM
ncbi:MAG: arginine--tRNA ligase [Oscillospiraceae bacterium]|nr:arginine--tRNA ligase [Oscillospiraceae bacterium]